MFEQVRATALCEEPQIGWLNGTAMFNRLPRPFANDVINATEFFKMMLDNKKRQPCTFDDRRIWDAIVMAQRGQYSIAAIRQYAIAIGLGLYYAIANRVMRIQICVLKFRLCVLEFRLSMRKLGFCGSVRAHFTIGPPQKNAKCWQQDAKDCRRCGDISVFDGVHVSLSPNDPIHPAAAE